MKRLRFSIIAFVIGAGFVLGASLIAPTHVEAAPNQGCLSVLKAQTHAPPQADERLDDVAFRLCPV
jgi:hypothetical protein